MATVDIGTILFTPEQQQYQDVFIKNFHSASSTTKLSVRRLSSLRLSDFPQMAITNYGHQKVLMKNVRASLANASSEVPLNDNEFISRVSPAPPTNPEDTANPQNDLDASIKKKPLKKRKSFEKARRPSLERRPSLDAKSQLFKIDKMQSQLDRSATSGKVEKIRRRSFDPNDGKREKNKLLEEVERNVENMHVPGAPAQKTQRKSLGKGTELGMRFNKGADEEADKKYEMKERAKQYGDAAQKTALADDGLAKVREMPSD